MSRKPYVTSLSDLDGSRVAMIVDIHTMTMATGPITSHEQCEHANDLRKQLNDLRIDLDKARKHDKQPYLDAQRKIEDAFKAAVKPIREAIEHLDSQRRAYDAKIERERELAQAAAQVQPHVQAGSDSSFMADLSSAAAVPEPAPVRTRSVKQLEITDPSQIPSKFWVIDEVAVRRALLDGETVPGARLVDERRMA